MLESKNKIDSIYFHYLLPLPLPPPPYFRRLPGHAHSQILVTLVNQISLIWDRPQRLPQECSPRLTENRIRSMVLFTDYNNNWQSSGIPFWNERGEVGHLSTALELISEGYSQREIAIFSGSIKLEEMVVIYVYNIFNNSGSRMPWFTL